MIELILAVLNASCGVALICALAIHPEVYKFPVACRLSVWAGAVGLIMGSTNYLHPSPEVSLLASLLTNGGYWILLIASLLEARRLERERAGQSTADSHDRDFTALQNTRQ